MAVDEFGREIPQPQTHTTGSSRTSTSRHHHHHHHRRRPPSPPQQQRGSRHGQQQRRRSSETGGHSSRSTSSSKAANHPSKRYQSEPLLCEFVWKDQQKKKKEEKKEKKEEDESQEEGTTSSQQQQQQQEENDDKEVIMKEGDDNDDDDTNNNTSSSSYSDYKHDYCLQYVRAFFNQHLDDSWFRQQYSPLERKRLVLLQNRVRAADEARSIRTSLQNDKTTFVKQARLWKQDNNKNDANTTNVQSHVFSWNDRLLHVVDLLPEVTDEQLQQALMDFVEETTSVEPNSNKKETQQQQQQSPLLQVFNATPERNTLVREAIVVCRSAALQQQLLSALQARQQRRSSSSSSSHHPRKVVPRKDTEDDINNMSSKWLQLDVDYSDPYNRLEYDANGKGGAPADGLAVPTRKCVVRVRGLSSYLSSSPSPSPSLGSSSSSSNNKVVTLSAALSHPSRIARDKEAAILMARALDVSQHIPTECRLDEILESLMGVGGGEQQQQEKKKLSSAENSTTDATNATTTEAAAIIEAEEEEANVLDVAIAFLRRVHLFSFYNCCSLSDNVANVMIGKHAASTIHLRLPNAEDILQTTTTTTTGATATENQQEGTTETKDLLVQRLDDSIAKALEDCNAWINSGGDGTVIDEQTDQDADAIEQAMASAHEQWLQDHSIDDGGRARCSFHFCHKLFKDASFLHKHLLKKHGEFLKAEQAKCHDEYMMKAWDAEEKRPVPDILVDCGANFGLVATSITGQEPDCIDPEPELWRKEEERRQREAEQRQRREEMRQQRQQQNDMADHHHAAAAADNVNAPHRGGAPAAGTSFVDVDDMKEEKVELSFENVEIPAATTKKKKKKKRKLL